MRQSRLIRSKPIQFIVDMVEYIKKHCMVKFHQRLHTKNLSELTIRQVDKNRSFRHLSHRCCLTHVLMKYSIHMKQASYFPFLYSKDSERGVWIISRCVISRTENREQYQFIDFLKKIVIKCWKDGFEVVDGCDDDSCVWCWGLFPFSETFLSCRITLICWNTFCSWVCWPCTYAFK